MRRTNQERLSIAEVTRRILASHPSLLDALRLGVVNYSSLAEYIQGEVEAKLGRETKVEAIKIALIRYADELAKEKGILESIVADVVSKSVLELKNDLVVITAKTDAFLAALPKLLDAIHSARFVQITQGADAFTMVADLKTAERAKAALGEKNLLNVINDQSAIILVSPPEIITTPGVVAYVTYLLFSNGVNITQIISCHTDTIFIVNRDDALRAYSILERQILWLRGRMGTGLLRME